MAKESAFRLQGFSRPALNSLATVLMLAVAMPGRIGWWPFLFVALVPLLRNSSGLNPSRSALYGLLAGFFYHVLLLYWIVIVLGRYGGLSPLLAGQALVLLAMYMAVFTSLFTCLLSFALQGCREEVNASARVILLAPPLWVGLDWLRGILFTGFPWMDIGYGLASVPLLVQAADLGGHHLITFVLVLVNALFFHGLVVVRRRKSSAGIGLRAIVAAVLCILAIGSYSTFRYQQVENVQQSAVHVGVAVVQGNIPQDEKWTPASKQATLDRYGMLTDSVFGQKPDLVVWPETALPFFPTNDPLFTFVLDMASARKVWLLTGAPYFSLSGDQQNPADYGITYSNSALLISPAGEVRARYDKQHLVPFGEYVPLQKFLTFLAPLVESVGNFAAGKSGEPLSVGSMKLGMLICYESIFPGLARKTVAAGANLLVNITNDAWYGLSSAPHQSFAMSVLRAVENRRALVRAANTGISGYVNPLGTVIKKSPLFEPLALSAQVPLMESQTVFRRYGYFFGPVCVILFFALLAHSRFRQRMSGYC